jgi:transcriptional regulator of acetoin/glycerol metabolism
VNELIQLATAHVALPRTRVSQLLDIGRATLYRHLQAPQPWRCRSTGTAG